MDFQVELASPTVAVIRLTGRLDIKASATLRTQLQEMVAGGIQRLAIDLEGVKFVDSSGLGALIAGLKAARVAGGDLRIARPGEQVRQVLSLSSLDRVLFPHATVEDALERLR